MQIQDYQQHLASLSFGKRLPTAVYIYWDGGANVGRALRDIVAALAVSRPIGAEYNVIKFRTDELKISFLDYPEFMEIAHPALRSALTVDLVTCRSRHISYIGNPNPPILHRKETFLPPSHPRYQDFASLTRLEEAAGLYEQAATIGFKLNWERLLAAKNLRIVDHTLERLGRGGSTIECLTGSEVAYSDGPVKKIGAVTVERHKTALTRYDLSKPVKTLLEYGVLRSGRTVFDYGCGLGSDVRGLKALGYQASGWDPALCAREVKQEADIVNFGYVLNVIEDPAERLEALVDAFRHAKRMLVVSAMISETVETGRSSLFGDGVLTTRNTFQKYFEQQELQQYIEDALEMSAIPVALGVFYVFRDPIEQQDFLSARGRRTIDWTQISARLGLGGPRTMWKALYDAHKELLNGFGTIALAMGRFPAKTEFDRLSEVDEQLGSAKRALRAYVQGGPVEGLDWEAIRVRFGIGQPPKRRWEMLYEENRELLDGFWSLMLQLGRLPEPVEYQQTGELREKIGSPKVALRILIQKGGGEEVRLAAENRKRDLLVYVALANLRKRVPFGHLSQSLRFDIREFFGNYTIALQNGMELLYAAGDTGEIELACEELKLGWQDEQALYIHRSVLDELPPVLRAYVGCATALFGDVSQTDVIKLHKASGKVTFLGYDDFEGKPLPELLNRIKVNLRTRWVQVFDHSGDAQLLYFKERFVGVNHPCRAEMVAFSAKLRKLGLSDVSLMGPTKAAFSEMLEKAGLNENLNRRRK